MNLNLLPRNPRNAILWYFTLLTIIFISLVFASKTHAQSNIFYKQQLSNGTPTVKPNSPVANFICHDSINDLDYLWKNNMWNPLGNIFGGKDGRDGAQGIQGVKGDKGDKGDPGSGSASVNSVTPEQFGACGCNNGLTDFNAFQAAFNTGQKIELKGGVTYYINGFLKRKKMQSFYMDMNFATIIETNTGAGDVIGCDQPANATEAIQMVNYAVVIKNGLISCNNQSQNGVNVKASSNDRFDNLTIVNANWGFRSEFMLQSRYTECTVLTSKNGWYIGQGSFSGADANNSQSNYSWLIQPHTHTVSNVGVYVENTYGVRIDDIIVEGNGTIVNGIQFESTASTTTKDLYVNTGHFEQTGGLTGAFVKINSRDAIVEVTDVIMHYSGLLIDATSTTGAGSVLVTKCSYAVGVNGKYLKSNNTTWQFNYNNLFQCWNLPNLWVTPAPTRYSGNSGYNQYNCSDWGR